MIKNTKNFLAILILSLVILAAIIFLARPLIFQCLEIYKQNKDKRTEIESYEKNIANLKAVESQIEDISFTIEKAKNFIPGEANISDFIVQLEAAAKESEISLAKIDLGEDKETSQAAQPAQGAEETGAQQNQSQTNQSSQQQPKQTKIIDIPGTEETVISVGLKGKYSQLISFLNKMKKLSRFNIIKNLSIQGAEGESETITISLYVIIFSKSGT